LQSQTARNRLARIASHTILIIASVVTLLPLMWIARTSFVSKIAAYTIPPDWLAKPSLENYQTIFTEQRFLGFFLNSVIVSLGSALLAVAIGSVAAYGIARSRRPTAMLRIAALSGQLFPRIVLILPIYTIVRILGGLDNHGVFVVSFLAFMLPAATAILTPYFEAIPVEMEEAAMVDGASRVTALWRVVIPMALPGIGSAGVFAFILGWNEFIFPLFLGGKHTRTLPVAIGAFVTQRGVDIGPVAAATMLAVMPVVLLTILTRRLLIEGLTAGGTEG
jgi:ABC-type glycerol-3-phosphate transport system permease component